MDGSGEAAPNSDSDEMDGAGEAAPNWDLEADWDVEEQYTIAKVSVWWYLDMSDGYNEYCAYNIKDNICSALVGKKCHGPVSFFCYGDHTLIPRPVLSALSITGIHVEHLGQEEKDFILNHMAVEMMLWAHDNPAPATYLLIVDDVRFSYVGHRLQLRGYNFILTLTRNVSEPLILVPAPKSVLDGAKGKSQQWWIYVAVALLGVAIGGTFIHKKRKWPVWRNFDSPSRTVIRHQQHW